MSLLPQLQNFPPLKMPHKTLKIMKDVMYRYAKMELEQFAIFEENMKDEHAEIQVQTEAQFKYDQPQNVLCSKITVTFSIGESPLMRAVIDSYFLIHPDSIRGITDSEGHIIFPTNVLVQFASLNYGSLRGIIHLKTLGTKLSGYILPPIFFNDIITKEYIAE